MEVTEWDELETIAKEVKSKPMLRRMLDGKGYHPKILIKIINNQKLYRIYDRAHCTKHSTLLEALDSYKVDNIMTYFSEIGLYGIFENIGVYHEFIKTIVEKQEEDDCVIPFTPYQIVLNSSKQRLVFVYTGSEESIEKLRQHVKECFSSEVVVNKGKDETEITVLTPIQESGNATNLLFDQLYNYICRKDQDFAKKITPIISRTERDYAYKSFNMSNSLSAQNMEQLLASLKTIPSVVININNNGGQIVINNNNIAPVKSSSEIALEWIKNNLPDEKEITTKYYERYSTALQNNIVVNSIFGKLVRSLGFEPVHGNKNSRYWIKNK